jgi:radical SAM protein with 4Fe4S-binding SPASM domain
MVGDIMHDISNTPCIEVDVDDLIYEIELGPIQIEITGRCNMTCEHCRASEMPKLDMPVKQVIKIMKFARMYSPNYKEVTLSGGEPFLHNDFREILRAVRENGADYLTITTNGSLVTDDILQYISKLKFERLMLSVSVDALNAADHDLFRHSPGSYNLATNTLQRIAKLDNENIVASMKTVIKPNNIDDMEKFVALASSLGCKRISFTSVIASGLALKRNDLWMSQEQKKQFLIEIYRLKSVYPNINITTNDPLKCLIRGYSDLQQNDNELVFDGCPAATVTFNVNVDGTMTPCPLLNVPMMNITTMSIDEIAIAYQNNEIVRDMLRMNLQGKCGVCSRKYQCGGCRARALCQNGHIMAEDPECWI